MESSRVAHMLAQEQRVLIWRGKWTILTRDGAIF